MESKRKAKRGSLNCTMNILISSSISLIHILNLSCGSCMKCATVYK